MSKYLVITGNEYGFDLGNMVDLKFHEKEKAEDIYNEFIEEYDCAAMYKVNENGLELIKMDSFF